MIIEIEIASPPPKVPVWKKLLSYSWYVFLLFYLELLLSFSCFRSFTSLPYVALTSLSVGLFLYAITTINFAYKKTNTVLSILITLLLILAYVSEVVYYKIFATFFTLTSFTMAADVAQYYDIILKVLSENLIILVVMLLPLLVLFLKIRMGAHFTFPKRILFGLGGVLIYAALFLGLSTGFFISENDTSVYNNSFLPATSFETFGAVISFQSDFMQLMGLKQSSNLDSLNRNISTSIDTTESTTTTDDLTPDDSATDESTADDTTDMESTDEIIYGEHVLDIDFAALAETETDDTLASLHTYFANADTQSENEYTYIKTFYSHNVIILENIILCGIMFTSI